MICHLIAQSLQCILSNPCDAGSSSQIQKQSGILEGHGVKVSMCLQVSETGCGRQVCSGGQCCLGQRISPCLSQYRDCEKVDKRDPGGSAEQAQHGAIPCSGLAARSTCQRQTSCQQACVQPGQGLGQVYTILRTHMVSIAHRLSILQPWQFAVVLPKHCMQHESKVWQPSRTFTRAL